MFGILGSLAKATVGVALLPLDLVEDIVDPTPRNQKARIEKRAEQIGQNLENAVDPNKD